MNEQILCEASDLTLIADALRARTGTDTLYNVPQLSQAAADMIYGSATGIILIDIVNGYKYLVQMENGTLTTSCAAASIQIATMPNKVKYAVGEEVDLSGLVIVTDAYDGSSKEVVNYDYEPKVIGEDTDGITVIYNEGGIKHTAKVLISVAKPITNPEVELIDFDYIDNGDGTYTLTGWKGTTNGVAGTEILVPDAANIII